MMRTQMASAERSILREGIVAGLIGAAVVAVWFLVFDIVRGQPFLTQRGLHQIVEQGLSYAQFAAGAARDEGPYGDHLRRIFVSLNQDPALCDAVRDVISGRHSSSSDCFYRLRSSGVVAGDSAREMRLRCQLYEQYLSRYLN